MTTKVFISYSRDSKKHILLVKKFVAKLKKINILTIFDEEDIVAGDDLINFMNRSVLDADKILLICTPNYAIKANNGLGGVGYENMIITSRLFQNLNIKENRIIPIIFSGDKDSSLPTYIKTKQYLFINEDKFLFKLKNAIYKQLDYNNFKTSRNKKEFNNILQNEFDLVRIRPFAYRLIGPAGVDGIKVLWSLNHSDTYIESLAFNQRTKINPTKEDLKISSYTISVSAGCILKSMNVECKFCRTGCLPFNGNLSAYEIALQNIMMVISDIECPSFHNLKENAREFAYMGQGEPGFSYSQIRKAIKITNYAMKKLNQKVHRHLISTCGIPDLIENFISDKLNNYFDSEVTIHFSLHHSTHRDLIMPINKIYPYKYVIKQLSNLANSTGEKPCVSILIFNNYIVKSNLGKHIKLNTDSKTINSILKELNPKYHRISICEFNSPKTTIKPIHIYNEIVNEIKEKNFGVKFFASFGTNEISACGMLSSDKRNIRRVGDGFMKHYGIAKKILIESINEMEYL